MALTMATTSAMPAFAAEVAGPVMPAITAEGIEYPDKPVDPLSPAPAGICYETTVYGYYTTVTTAHNCNNRFYIGNLPYGYKVDIRMLNGNTVVWEENGAMTGNSSRIFWCGSNITAVQARVTNWNGAGASDSYTFGVDTEV